MACDHAFHSDAQLICSCGGGGLLAFFLDCARCGPLCVPLRLGLRGLSRMIGKDVVFHCLHSAPEYGHKPSACAECIDAALADLEIARRALKVELDVTCEELETVRAERDVNANWPKMYLMYQELVEVEKVGRRNAEAKVREMEEKMRLSFLAWRGVETRS